MDTLISIGTLAAWGWSVVALVLLDDPHAAHGGEEAHTYFEVAAVITTLDPARPLPRGPRAAPVGRRDPRAARARREGGAGCSATASRCSSRSRSSRVGDLVRRAAGREDRRPTASSSTGDSAVDQSMLTGEPVPVEVEPGSDVAGATINTYGRLRRARDTRRRRDGARADRASRGRGAVRARRRSSGSSTACRPSSCPVVIVIALCDARRLAARDRRRDRRVHGGGRRADHRLPVRARPRDADRAHGRHRARRAARDPDQGAGGARAARGGSRRSCSTRPAPSPRGACRAGRR